MNVNVWMPSGQPIKRQMKKRPLQHKTRTLSNPITFAWDQGDVVGENDNWKSKITCNKYTVLYSVQKLHIVGRKIITNTGVKCSSILLKTTTTATRTCAKFENDKVTAYPQICSNPPRSLFSYLRQSNIKFQWYSDWYKS